MENLNNYIRHLYDDFTLPSARGVATTHYPALWDEEYHANAAVYEQLKERGYSISDIDDTIAKPRHKQEEEDNGMKIDWVAVHKFIDDIKPPITAERMLMSETHCTLIEAVLVEIASQREWEHLEPYYCDNSHLYRIR